MDAIANRLKSSSRSAVFKAKTLDDSAVVEAAKAIYDTVMGEFAGHVGKAMQPHMKDFESSLMVLMGKTLRKELDGEIASLAKDCQDKLDGMKAYYEDKLSEMRKAYDDRLSDMRASSEAGQKQLQEIVQALPRPQINVPKNAIHVNVNQQPSVVNIPENAFQVNIDQKPSIVNLPEGAIQLSIPEHAFKFNMKAPTVNIPKDAFKVDMVPQVVIPDGAIKVNVESKSVIEQQPKRKQTVSKSIVYDENTGRPSKIVETTEDE